MSKEEKEIYQAMQQNQEQGFRKLMARYKEPLYWHTRRILVSHEDAQDATQDAFVRIYRSFSQFSGEHSLTAWVYRIATNEALRILDKRKTETSPIDALAGVTADSYVDYSDLEGVRLQKAILKLPPKQQLAFTLRYYDDMSYEQIASVTDATVTTAKVNYHLAKEKIVKYMQTND